MGLNDFGVYRPGQFGFPACSPRDTPNIVRHLPMPERKPKDPPEGPCCICGEEATSWVSGDSPVCRVHFGTVTRLVNKGVTDALGSLKAMHEERIRQRQRTEAGDAPFAPAMTKTLAERLKARRAQERNGG